MTLMNTLEIEGLRLHLPGAVRPVLDGVGLTVGPRETVALVGESGSGKSLTSRSVLRLLPEGAQARMTLTSKQAPGDRVAHRGRPGGPEACDARD